LVPVENDKKGVTLAVTASLLSSQLLPPFIIDTGSFGADLMTSWSNYTKSICIFNKSHWMTQYASFIIYLDWAIENVSMSKVFAYCRSIQNSFWKNYHRLAGDKSFITWTR
jgi:hypothetical protein